MVVVGKSIAAGGAVGDVGIAAAAGVSACGCGFCSVVTVVGGAIGGWAGVTVVVAGCSLTVAWSFFVVVGGATGSCLIRGSGAWLAGAFCVWGGVILVMGARVVVLIVVVPVGFGVDFVVVVEFGVNGVLTIGLFVLAGLSVALFGVVACFADFDDASGVFAEGVMEFFVGGVAVVGAVVTKGEGNFFSAPEVVIFCVVSAAQRVALWAAVSKQSKTDSSFVSLMGMGGSRCCVRSLFRIAKNLKLLLCWAL